jgi:hypothetical protein
VLKKEDSAFMICIIYLDLQKVGFGGMDWTELAQDRDACECGNESSGSIKRRGIS